MIIKTEYNKYNQYKLLKENDVIAAFIDARNGGVCIDNYA